VVLQALCREVRMQQEQLARARHAKLLALRAYKAAEDALLAAQEELPPLKIAKWVTALRTHIPTQTAALACCVPCDATVLTFMPS
jgi:hypothetical protein